MRPILGHWKLVIPWSLGIGHFPSSDSRFTFYVSFRLLNSDFRLLPSVFCLLHFPNQLLPPPHPLPLVNLHTLPAHFRPAHPHPLHNLPILLPRQKPLPHL